MRLSRWLRAKSADERRAVRQELGASLVADLETWMRAERPKLSRGSDLAKAMDYMLKRGPAFTRFQTGASACRTTLQNAPCAALRSGASRGSSPAPTVAANKP